MAKVFITEEMRMSEGQFTRVSDGAMFNLGIERQGYCQACGHEIERHFGVKSPDGAYYWVGKECLKTLTGAESEIETSSIGSRYSAVNGVEWVNVGRDYLDEIDSYLYREGKDKYGCPARYYSRAYFGLVDNIIQQAYHKGRRTGEYVLSAKQLNIIENWATRNGIELQTKFD